MQDLKSVNYWTTREVLLFKNKWKIIINMLKNTNKISKILPDYFVKYLKKTARIIIMTIVQVIYMLLL